MGCVMDGVYKKLRSGVKIKLTVRVGVGAKIMFLEICHNDICFGSIFC